MLDIFLARPHELDRTFRLLRESDRLIDDVDFQPAAEAAAR